MRATKSGQAFLCVLAGKDRFGETRLINPSRIIDIRTIEDDEKHLLVRYDAGDDTVSELICFKTILGERVRTTWTCDYGPR